MKVHFAINLYDSDGDCYDKGIYLFIEDRTILKFDNITELEEFYHQVKKVMLEIFETTKD